VGRIRWATLVATGLFVATLGLWLGVLWAGLNDAANPIAAPDVAWGLSFLAFPVVGWILAVKLPGNPLGWIYVVFSLLIGIAIVVQENAKSWSGGAPDSVIALAVLASYAALGFGLWLILGPGVLLFPDGRLPGSRFRWALWTPAALLAAVWAVYVLTTAKVCVDSSEAGRCLLKVDNPMGLFDIGAVLGDEGFLPGVIVMAAFVVSLTGLVLRYRRSRGEARQQIKWVAFAVVAAPIAVLGLALVEGPGEINEWMGVLPILLGFVGVPVAMAVAIFKYRLYDIDRIINRTTVYAIVVGLLAVVFAAGAVWIPSLLPFEESNLAVAASTLAVFFLFNPLRQRTQRFVDRRFYRSRYDAQQVADEFSARLRDQVDPDQVAAEWVEVVQRTLQPAAVAVWVREGW
jgi:hypothetical protein